VNRNIRNLFFIIVSSLFVFSCNRGEVRKTVSNEDIHYDFSEMNNFFSEYVSDGKVNYTRVKEDKALDKIISDIRNIEPYLIEDGNERLAFWINVYNIYTIELISDYYPVESILDIEQTTGMNPWKINFIEMAGGRKFSLDEIEKKIIIPKYKDPRVHYALVCAAESCPQIIPETYLPDKLDEQLQLQASIFLNNKEKNYLDKKEMELNLSMIYKWYRTDFIKKDSGIINHVLKYINEDDKEFINEKSVNDISYIDYSWKLNDNKKQ
jgi:Protein of unknown function, DUF547